jgi:hypothetical protein
MIKSISIFLLLVGLLWGFLLFLIFVMSGGASELAFLAKGLLAFSWMFAGPLLLIAGSILTLMGTGHKVGARLSLLGCFILTVMVGYQTLSALHDIADPLITKPPYVKYAIAIILTLSADAGAVQVYRLVSVVAAR